MVASTELEKRLKKQMQMTMMASTELQKNKGTNADDHDSEHAHPRLQRRQSEIQRGFHLSTTVTVRKWFLLVLMTVALKSLLYWKNLPKSLQLQEPFLLA